MRSTLILLCTLAIAGAAQAHTELAATAPANGSTVAVAPHDLTLTFSAAVTLTMLTIRAADQDARTLGPLPAAPAKSFAIGLPPLERGLYVVSWRALSADTHVVRGEFSFSVGDSNAAPPPEAHAGHGSHTEHR